MTIELANYWARLAGTVHPCDMHTFAGAGAHGFNLDFPPPAFVGDIVNAPVIILNNNGGYDPLTTPQEFPDSDACDEYRQLLAAPCPIDPTARSLSPYYLQRNYSAWLISGKAALVNGVAYRSKDGAVTGVKRLSKQLPSAQFHQRWLREVLTPLALRAERFVVVHRWTRWNGAENHLRGMPFAFLSDCPVGNNLTTAEISAAQAFLDRQ